VRRSAAAFGCVLFVACCSLPWVGLWDPNGVADTGLYGLYGSRMAHGQVPYRDFYVEFPPGALLALVLPALPGSSFVWWFKGFACLCGIGCVAFAAATTRRPWRAALAAGIAPALLGAITLNSFDLWPALLTVAAVCALVGGRETLGAFALGLATAAKIFPVLALPLFVLHARRRTHALVAYCAALAVTFLPFAVLAPGGLGYSLRTQANRGLQMESLWASFLLGLHQVGAYSARVVVGKPYSLDLAGTVPDALRVVSTIAVVVCAIWIWLRYARGPRTNERVIAAVTAVVLVFAVLGRVLSPQYLLWLVPLVPLDGLAATLLFLLALGVTQIWARFPRAFDSMAHLGAIDWAVLARNVVLVALLAVLVRRIRPARNPEIASTMRLRASRSHTPQPSPYNAE
jgi:Glycosyltransferase family 87